MSNYKNKIDLKQVLSYTPRPKNGFKELSLDNIEQNTGNLLTELNLEVPKNRFLGIYSLAAAAAVLLVSCIGIYFFVFSTGSFIEKKQKVAVVLQVKGNAYYIDSSNSKIALKKADILRENQRIETSSRSSIDLSLPGGVLVRVAPLSKYQLHQINAQNPGRIVTHLQRGSVYNLVEKLAPEENFSVSTPTAIAGVRGTSFRVTVGANKTMVHVVQGSVAITQKAKGKKEYILEQYDKNYIELETDKVIKHTTRMEDDFSDARQLDALSLHLKDPDLESMVLDKKGFKRALLTKKERQQIYSIIRLHSGEEIHGLIISQNEGKIFVETTKKSLILLSSEVAGIKFVDSE